MKKTGISNQLLGRVMVKAENANEMMWPSHWTPNASGEYIGVIEAVWVDNENELKAVISNPVNGQITEVYVTHHRVLPAR
jgi:hypothetical protein